MADSDNKQFGEGQDSYGNAAKQAAKAAKQIGQRASEKTAQKGAEAAFNAATNTVKAGIKTGKAVSEIAAGTAVGGPVGAIISAAWSMRHTIFKVLICVCLAVLFIVVTVVALPGILIENIVNVFTPESDKPVVLESYYDLSAIVISSIERGHTYGEIDFVLQYGTEIIPIEVKGGEDKSAPSFKRYISAANPEYAVRLSTRGYMRNGNITNIPLYLARKTRDLL